MGATGANVDERAPTRRGELVEPRGRRRCISAALLQARDGVEYAVRHLDGALTGSALVFATLLLAARPHLAQERPQDVGIIVGPRFQIAVVELGYPLEGAERL